MFCRECGSKLVDDCDYCPNCGTKKSNPPKINQNPAKLHIRSFENSDDNLKSPNSRSFSFNLIVIVVVILVLGVSASALTIYFHRNEIKKFDSDILTNEDAKSLYDFLNANKNKIVMLNISYYPHRYLNASYSVGSDKNNIVEIMGDSNSMFNHLSYSFVNCPKNIGEGVHSSCTVDYGQYPYSDVFKRKMFYIDPANPAIYRDATTGKEIQDLTHIDLFNYEMGGVVPYKLLGWCNIEDIPCQLSQKEYASYPLAGLIFSGGNGCPLAPSNCNESVDYKVSLVNEVVLLAGIDIYNFSASHKNVSFKNNIEYVDSGALSFILSDIGNDVSKMNEVMAHYIDEEYIVGYKNEKEEYKKVHSKCKPKNFMEMGEKFYKYNSFSFEDECYYILTSAIAFDSNDQVQYTSQPEKSIIKYIFEKFDENMLVDKNGLFPKASSIYENSYQIQINKSSENNTVYKWNSDDLRKFFPKYDQQLPDYGIGGKMYLSGYFYVEFTEDSSVDDFPPQYCNLQNVIADRWIRAGFESKCKAKVIKLEPISSKEIELRKYN